jgi:mono/diheme cytochrome c family protein
MFSNTIKGKKLVNWVARAIEAKLKQKNAAAQPAVPDALTSADIQEHIEYVAGWNDCRQAVMEMMK